MSDSVSALLSAETNQPQRRLLHDQVNDAEIERLVSKFGPSTSVPVDPAQLTPLASGPDTSR